MLIIVDSPAKVGSVRALLKEHNVTDIVFPLYARFTRKAKKLKDVSFPTLRVIAQKEIQKLVRLASGSEVLGVFDDTEYGRVEARDLAYALSDVNVRVSFRFIKSYTRVGLESSSVSLAPDVDTDAKYILNRIASMFLSEISADYVGEADFNLSWQELYVLSVIFGNYKQCSCVDTYTDAFGRVYSGSFDEQAPSCVKSVRRTVSPVLKTVLELASDLVPIGDLFPTLEKLRGAGLISVCRTPMSDPSLSEVSAKILDVLSNLGIEARDDISDIVLDYCVLDVTRAPVNVPGSTMCKALFETLRQETLLAMCDPLSLVYVRGSSRGLSTAWHIPTASSEWLKFSGITCAPAVELAQPDKSDIKESLSYHTVDSRELSLHTSALLTDRDLWLACTWLLRNNFVFQRDGHWFLSSRGCLAIKLFGAVFPNAVSEKFGKHILDEASTYLAKTTNTASVLSQEDLLARFRVYMIENTVSVAPSDFWSGGFGDLQPNVSDNAVWFTGNGESYGLVYNGADFETVPEDIEVVDPCPECGAHLVNTKLDMSWETSVSCSCGNVRKAVSIEKEVRI